MVHFSGGQVHVSVADTANCYYYVSFKQVCQYTCLLQVFREIKIQDFDASQYETEQVFYESKDGTKIPMFIVHKKVSNIILMLSEQS